MNARSVPPAVLGSQRVLSYVTVPEASVFLAGRAGERATDPDVVAPGPVPHLAIAESLDDPATIELLYCGADWKVLGRRSAESADAARVLAEQSYSGIADHWRQLPGTRDDALAFYDQSNEKSRCSFCSKRAFQVAILIEGARLIEGANGIVCNECVARFRRATQAN